MALGLGVRRGRDVSRSYTCPQSIAMEESPGPAAGHALIGAGLWAKCELEAYHLNLIFAQ